MMFHVVTTFIILFTDASLSADLHLSLSSAVNDNNDQGLKTVAIKGIAKYKPGGSAMILNLLIQGPPGIMPGSSGPAGSTSTSGTNPITPAVGSAGPGSQPTSSPTSGTGTSGTSKPSCGVGSTTSGGTGGAGGGDFKPFESEALDAHNKFRAVHGSQPMKLNRQMCDEAAEYAKTIAQQGQLRHSSREQRNSQGENLSMGCSTNSGQTTTEAVNNWYNEVCSPGYEFSVGRGQGGTGHFTQVVWNDSTELGIGKADSVQGRMKCTYIVGRYKPLGNFFTGNNDYKKNVKQGSFNRQAYCSSIKSSSAFKKTSSFFSKVLKRK
ncbi:protein PRY1-like [Actinia tenebrosa]|uniref:Protein PRY1-like n=1 Tax=Actinia tenebrosa TaxID=6105 RepID=A0A6P8I867_ACTTE|nr:protein PRY1-like [Actinia tenebrosa]